MTESRISAPRLLAGLQAGTLAGLVLLGWFLLLSYYYFREPWALMNVLAASLRHNATWGHSFSSVTWTGLAAHLAACSLLGIVLGWILPRPGPTARVSITGLTFGVVLSLLVYEFFWLRFAPLLGEYIAPLAMWVAHLLFGISVAQFPRFYLQLADPEPVIAMEEAPAAESQDAAAVLPVEATAEGAIEQPASGEEITSPEGPPSKEPSAAHEPPMVEEPPKHLPGKPSDASQRDS